MKTIEELKVIQNGKILFSASFCAPCRGIIAHIGHKNITDIEVFKVDDHISEVKEIWGIKTVPTLIVVDNGVQVAKFVGELEVKQNL